MRKKFASVGIVLALALTLGACTVNDIINGMKQACNYVPAEKAVMALVGILFPGVGSILSALQVQEVIDAGCKAVNEAKADAAAKGKKSISIPIVAVTDPRTGRIVRMPLPPAR
jgi:hypothetical protein